MQLSLCSYLAKLEIAFLANGREIQRIINTHVEASKIGSQIAEQVLDSQRRGNTPSSEGSPGPESSLPTPHQNVSNSIWDMDLLKVSK